MTDIDFDELDKAVNNLMGNVVSKDPDDTVKEKNLSIDSTLKPGEKPSYDKLGEVAKGIGNETLVTRGEQTFVEELSSKLPTTELAIAELDAINSKQDTETPVASIVQPKPMPVQRPNSGRAMDVVRSSSAARPLPTPIVTTVEPIESAPTVEVSPEMVPAVESTLVDMNIQASEAPRLTPFLPDTKVEKRPLGDSSTSSVAVEMPSIDNKSAELDSTATNEIAEEISEPSEPPKEIQKNDDTQHDPDPVKAANDNSIEQEMQAIESTAVSDAEPPIDSIRAVESGDTEKLSSGSITQQYQEKASETPDAAGAIYDVNEYHKAMGRPAKQKSGWGVVLLIIVIIIVCAAIGAAAYFVLGAGL